MTSTALSPTISKGIISSAPPQVWDTTEKDSMSSSSASGDQRIPLEKEPLPNNSSGTVDIEAAATGTTAPPQSQASPHPYTGLKWYLLLIGLYLTAFLYGLDNTIVANIQGSVITDFGHVEQLSWLGSGFPLGSVGTILPIGMGFGIFDNKWLYVTSIVIFMIGSAVCGAAPNMNALIIGRVIGGIGGAGMYLGVLNLLGRFTTIRERSGYYGIVSLIWGTGSILGPVIGGAFADSSATWRWAFYINLVLIAITSPIYLIFIPSTHPQPSLSFLRGFLSLDWLGATLNAGIYVAWVIALQFGGSTWAWSDGRTIATFVVLGVLIIVFTGQQYFAVLTTPARRIFPTMFLKRRTPMLMFVSTACVTVAVFIPIFYIPVYFQFVHGDSGLDSAVRLLPLVVVLVVVTVVTGFGLPIIGWYQPFFLISGILGVIGAALMYTVHADTTPSYIYGATALLGVAGGIGTSKGYSLLPALLISPSTHHTAHPRSPEPQYIPASIAFLNIAQIGSIVHALAISGSIFQNVAYKKLLSVFDRNGLHFAEADVRAAVAGTRSVVFEELDARVKSEAIDAIVGAIGSVYALALASGALLVVTAACMRWERLFQKAKAKVEPEAESGVEVPNESQNEVGETKSVKSVL